ncbi:membrane protein [Bacteroidia bacterium]|nr:membrane protein [Bacteroidia bacterium]
MKKLKLFIVLLSTAVCSSCESDLDIVPVENNVSGSFYANELEVNQAAIGIYSRLGKYSSASSVSNTDFPTEYYLLASEDRSDIRYLAGNETSAQNDQLELRKYLISPNSGTVSSIFSRLYSMIADANSLLARTPADKYLRYRGEAQFLRAFAYNELARAFGPVALITTPIDNKDALQLPRAPLADIYAQIITDLTAVADNTELADVYTGANAGRIGRLAAKALLGQVYMTMSGYPLNDPAAAAKAVGVYAPIIAQVEARFAPDYADIFTLANENKYDLFSVQFASGGLNVGSSLPGYITNSGSGQSPFPDWMYNSYGQQGQDLRIDSFLVREMIDNNDKRLLASVDTAYWGNADHTTRVTRTILTKFLEKDNTNTTIKAWNDHPRNFPVIRPAEVLLYYAEALIATGKASDAAPFINKVRNRAGLSDLDNTPTLDDIEIERKYEFIGEGKRYFDLVRRKGEGAVQTLSDFASHYHSTTNGQLPSKRDLLLPIPQNELKTRTNWEQNYGYY